MEKTDKTKKEYIRRAKNLLASYKDETFEDWRDNPLQAVQYIAEKRYEWSMSTWRLYKSSLIYFMQNYGPIEAVQYLTAITSQDCQKNSDRTSSKKTKHIPKEDLQTLLEYIESSNSKYKHLLSLWLKSTILTGLRPIEWDSAYINKNDALYVYNAKNTNDRSFEDQRVLFLDNLSEGQKNIIKLFLEKLNSMKKEKSFDHIYQTCKKNLYLIQNKIWPKRKKKYALYSARHQFISNHKKNDINRQELAALLGHKTTKTASFHYSKGVYGYDEFLYPIHTKEDIVERIKNEAVKFETFLKKQESQDV